MAHLQDQESSEKQQVDATSEKKEEDSKVQLVSPSKQCTISQFIEKDKEGTLDSLTELELQEVLDKLEDFTAAKEKSLEHANQRTNQIYDHMTCKQMELQRLDRQKREAINAYRPVKR